MGRRITAGLQPAGGWGPDTVPGAHRSGSAAGTAGRAGHGPVAPALGTDPAEQPVDT